ncbi:MAG: hypothetical protein IM526_02525 [Microcystis sp. M38BS1]|uniref:hypothetical protein n=1 Tax=Microcystis sp. M38BS1 TaxID=2771188 RepID=UPI0031FDB3DD|nr:hypothetical protein [Microcystis sp. M38BS1]MCA6582534.1 hypothetical protein [Pseudanabaena sp. M34BS1SP1A06MG]
MPNSFYLSDLIGVAVNPEFVNAAVKINKAFQELDLPSPNPNENYKCVGKRYQTDKTAGKEFVEPVTIFHNDVLLTARKAGDYIENQYDNQFYVSLGIFDLDKTSATATLTKDNKLEFTWTDRAGKGKFSSKIPSYLIATSAPVLSYEGGVLDIRVPVESRSKNEAVFVGRLESKS